MRAKPVPTLFRFVDHVMSPLMRMISMAPLERPQESHAWHAQKFTEKDVQSIAMGKCVVITGDDTSMIKSGFGPLFHIPLIGGWRNYAVLEVGAEATIWHIGWVIRDTRTSQILRAELHKLPLYERRVRMLVGPQERTTTFCAFDGQGTQVPLTFVSKGRMGDGSEYRKIRLF